MGWKERFRQGSFRGVAFNIEAADSEFGRRLVAHEYPQQDTPFIEDLGRKARRFTVECYVLGDDYMTQRDALLIALERSGSGPLVHPYYGRLTAHVEAVKVRDSNTETRIARFQITFLETGAAPFPQATTDTVAVVKSTALSTKDKIKAAFTKAFAFAELPYAQTQDVLRACQAASDAIQLAQGAVNKLDAFAKDLQDIGGQLSQLVLDAEFLADSFLNLIGFGFLDDDQDQDSIPDLRESFSGISSLYTFNPSLGAPSESSAAFVQLIQLAAINTTGYIASQIAYSSQDEAFEYRNKVLEQIDAAFLTTLDDDVFFALADLRASVERDIASRAASLSRLISIELPSPTPALVVSNLLYGDISQEADIIARNRVRHPGLVSGTGIPIKVISDVQ